MCRPCPGGRPAPVGEVAEVGPKPADAVGIEAVGRLVEQEDLRVTQERTRQRQPLPHAEREPARPLVCCRLESYVAQHLLDPPGRNAAEGGCRPQMVPGRAAGVHAAGVEDRSDDPGRVLQIAVAGAVVANRTAVRSGESDHHPHRGRLPRAAGADEPRDAADRDVEGHVVNREALAVLLGES